MSKTAQARVEKRWLILISACLIPLVLYNLGEGFTGLLNPSPYYHRGFKDLHRRWVEEECIREGKSPNAVMDGRAEAPAAGKPRDADYPPWALVIGLIFTVHDWHATLLLFSAWTAGGLCLIALWGYQIGARESIAWGAALMLGILAIGTIRSSLDVGQYAIVVCGLLALSLMLDARRLDWLSGIALGLSMVKFSISLPFCLCFLVLGRWKTLMSAAVVAMGCSMWSWHLMHVPPWTAFQQASVVGAAFATSSPTPLKGLVAIGIPARAATWIMAMIVASFGAGVMWRQRRRPMLTLFAIACVIARLWTYHLYYDDPMMMFLLVALAQQTIAATESPARTRLAWAYLAVGCSLWLTLGHLLRWWGVGMQNTIWVAGLYCLLHPQITDNEQRLDAVPAVAAA